MNILRSLSLWIIPLVMGVLIVACVTGGVARRHYELSRFISPSTCGGCHSDIYKQWKGSSHSLAHVDELYNAERIHVLEGVKDKDERKEAEICVKCHTPIGYLTGFPTKASQDLAKAPDIAKKGIQCDYCHSMTGSHEVLNAAFKFDPGNGTSDPGTKRGPFKDARSKWHKSEYSGFHTGSRICGTCHNIKHVVFGTVLESTYEEWKKSPYNSSDPEKRITCQGCHMHQRPGMPATGSTERPDNPGKAAYNGPDRPHIFTHYFVGGNTWLGTVHNAKDQVTLAEERLKNTATLRIDGVDRATGRLTISVTNSGAGHDLPTGTTHIRQVWLHVTVKNSRGEVLFESGRPGSNGHLPETTIIYHTVFGDGTGKKVMNLARAREILKDYRIAAGETKKETLLLPARLPDTIEVEAVLKYRLLPQAYLDSFMGEKAPRLPIVDMAGVKRTLKMK